MLCPDRPPHTPTLTKQRLLRATWPPHSPHTDLVRQQTVPFTGPFRNALKTIFEIKFVSYVMYLLRFAVHFELNWPLRRTIFLSSVFLLGNKMFWTNLYFKALLSSTSCVPRLTASWTNSIQVQPEQYLMDLYASLLKNEFEWHWKKH